MVNVAFLKSLAVVAIALALLGNATAQAFDDPFSSPRWQVPPSSTTPKMPIEGINRPESDWMAKKGYSREEIRMTRIQQGHQEYRETVNHKPSDHPLLNALRNAVYGNWAYPADVFGSGQIRDY